METVEKKVSETILQKMKEVVIDGVTYKVAPPTAATLILMSEEISKLPNLEMDQNNSVLEVLSNAKDCKNLGDILAICIIGSKNISKQKEITKKYFFGLIKVKKIINYDNKKELANKILNTMSPSELNLMFANLLRGMQIADFFGITTFLIGVNVLKKTKEGGAIRSGV